MDFKDKIKSQEDLQKIIKTHQSKSEKVVQCHGCFDVLHPGHIRYFEFAKQQGDILVVSITADKFIVKGDDRPYMPQELRVESVAALQIVDYVYLDFESWAGPILSVLQPDIYVKGKEYQNQFSGVFGEERSIVTSYGGEVVFSSGDVVFSSSRFIKDFKKQFALDWEIYNIFFKRNGINTTGLKKTISDFKDKKVLVIGEAVLDEYNYSEVVDVSGEAPILTIRPLKSEKFTGAAGVIAKHISSLGGKAILFAPIGNDEAGNFLKRDLKENQVSTFFLEKESFSTVKKVRFIGDNQKLLKVDYSKNYYIDKESEDKIIDSIKQDSKDVDIIILADFSYGFITDKIREEVIKFGNTNKIPVIADTSGTLGGNILKYKDVFLISPTEKEARTVLDDKESGLSVIANRLLKMTNNKNILITLGANGLLLFKNNRFHIHGKKEEHLESEYLPAIEKNAQDGMGAGDAMISMISLAISTGASIAEAVYLGSICSSIEVNKVGNKPVLQEEVLNFIVENQHLIDVKS
jgi:rfaE bifunctional protein kinase chain/domain/rfaE bifunctional protein nucleotidyltransferase chain/domain